MLLLPADCAAPLINNEPEIWKVLPEANTKLRLFESSIPLPTIKAD